MDCVIFVTFDIIGEFYEELNEIFWINFTSGEKSAKFYVSIIGKVI